MGLFDQAIFYQLFKLHAFQIAKITFQVGRRDINFIDDLICVLSLNFLSQSSNKSRLPHNTVYPKPAINAQLFNSKSYNSPGIKFSASLIPDLSFCHIMRFVFYSTDQ